MFDPVLLTITMLGFLAVAAVLVAILLWHYDRLNNDAVWYLYRQRKAYHENGANRAIQPDTAREILVELGCLPQHYSSSGGIRWHDEYAQLLEFFLAICDDPQTQPQLMHGIFLETIRHNGHRSIILQDLIWMSYSYSGRQWVLWVDVSRESIDGSFLRNDSDAMFRNFGQFIHESAPISPADIRRICAEHMSHTS